MDELIDLFNYIEQFKKLKRAGWVREGVSDAESVADHSFSTAFMSILLADDLKVKNKEKIIKMALIHDLAEGKVSDIVTAHGKKVISSEKDKFEKEKKAMTELFSGIEKGKELIDLWIEYEAQISREAKLVKQLDKLEMAFQALEYEKDVEPSKLDEFFVNTRMHLKEPILIKMLDEIEKQRRKK